MTLSQSDVVKFLAKSPPQHEAYQILAAYIYAKSSHGNLPTETLSKLLSIQRKLSGSGNNFTPASPLGRAFEAVRTQLLAVNRQYLLRGPQAFGSLGKIGTASSPDAITAWTKATDGRVKTFDDGTTGLAQAIDAGRVAGVNRAGLSITDLPPPIYQPPPTIAATTIVQEGILNSVIEASLDPSSQEKTPEELELEQGRSTLARLRLEMVIKQKAKEENDARVREEERLEELRERGEGEAVGGSEETGEVSRVGVEAATTIPSDAPPSFDTVEATSSDQPVGPASSTVV